MVASKPVSAQLAGFGLGILMFRWGGSVGSSFGLAAS